MLKKQINKPTGYVTVCIQYAGDSPEIVRHGVKVKTVIRRSSALKNRIEKYSPVQKKKILPEKTIRPGCYRPAVTEEIVRLASGQIGSIRVK